MQNDVLQAGFPLEESSEEATAGPFQATQADFPTALWQRMLTHGQVTLGGVAPFISKDSPTGTSPPV